MRSEFETWLYVNTSMNHLYIHGESQDENGAYHNESIQILWTAWQHQQSKVDELQKRVDAAIYLLPSIKAENDLWGCDQVEHQIELLEQALNGGSNESN